LFVVVSRQTKKGILCALCGREKKLKFAGFILPIGRVIFSVADDQPLSAAVPTWAHRGG
jgi:hypothetical protein